VDPRVAAACARVLDVDPAALAADTPLVALGADSVALVALADALEEAVPGLVVDDAVLPRLATLGDVAGLLDGPVG